MTRQLLLALAFILTCSIPAQSQNQIPPTQSQQIPEPSKQIPDSSAHGSVYFMRSTGFQGSATAFTTFIDDQLVCRLNNKRFSIHEVKPGTHHFSVQFAGKKSKEKAERIDINIEAGKTYYIQLIFQPGMFLNNVYCQEVTENSAHSVMTNMKEDKDCQ